LILKNENMIKHLIEKKFTTKKEIEFELRKIFNFEKADKKEIETWPYKSELYVSPKILIGKEMFDSKNNLLGKIENFGIEYGLRYFILLDSGKKVCFTGNKIKVYNNLYKKEELIELHPTRAGKKFWSLGYLVSEKDYKKIYYNTDEYRNVYCDSLNKNFNTTGCTSPIQIKEIKEKISKTINDKYGVDWFFCRGKHYEKIKNIMLEKYKCTNLFLSEDWKDEIKRLSIESRKTEEYLKKVDIQKNKTKEIRAKEKFEKNKIRKKYNAKGVSMFEESVIKTLVENIEFNTPIYYSEKCSQKRLLDIENKTYYKLDFYDTELNIVIEVNGDYWHCNPDLYNENYINLKIGKSAKEIWEKDKKRKQRVINILNCEHFVIWENDWDKNKDRIIKLISKKVNFIKNEIKQSKKN